ncbi:unnamed protein product [Lota lota]
METFLRRNRGRTSDRASHGPAAKAGRLCGWRVLRARRASPSDTWGRRGYSATRFVRTAAHRQEHCFGHTGCEAPFMRSYSRNGALTEVPQDLHTQRDSQDHCPTWTFAPVGELCRTLSRAGPTSPGGPTRPPHAAGLPRTTVRHGELCRTLTCAGPPPLEVPQDLHTQRDPPGPLPQQVSSVGLLRELVPFFWRSHKTSTRSGTPQDHCPTW